ncbi:ATP-binding cassette domain-containing protein [Orbus wheelerorum]|uniref:ABC transporter ATP-binding protein n=1 Tax=Orbus wheelerorum TaxID=3074111 RepID=UPI00370D88C9
MQPLLHVDQVKKSFLQPNQKLFGRKQNHIIRDVSFSLYQGECLGIVGESGSGKSTLGKLILGLEKPDSGKVLFDNIDIHQRQGRHLTVRKNISAVFQDYHASVNPYFTVEQIIAEPIDIYEKLSSAMKKERIHQLLEQVGLNSSFYHRYPHKMSGGQLQRVCIARAIACAPKFILFDEAVSSLDISVQAQILSLLAQLQQQLNLTSIFITHDLTTVTYLCDRVMFFYQGRIIEHINPISNLSNVKHAYSKQLLQSVLGF